MILINLIYFSFEAYPTLDIVMMSMCLCSILLFLLILCLDIEASLDNVNGLVGFVQINSKNFLSFYLFFFSFQILNCF